MKPPVTLRLSAASSGAPEPAPSVMLAPALSRRDALARFTGSMTPPALRSLKKGMDEGLQYRVARQPRLMRLSARLGLSLG